MVAEGGGYENAFGWYNLGDDINDPTNRFIIFTCDVEPNTGAATRVWRHLYLVRHHT